MSEPNTSTNAANNAPKPGQGTPQPAPMYSITANSPRELMLKVGQALLKSNLFEHRMTKGGEDGTKEKVPYLLWNQHDSGKIVDFNDGITLTPEEAKMFPTGDGLPTVFASKFALRQWVAPSLVVAKINEKQLATATADRKRVSSASDEAVFEEANKRRIAAGLPPIEF